MAAKLGPCSIAYQITQHTPPDNEAHALAMLVHCRAVELADAVAGNTGPLAVTPAHKKAARRKTLLIENALADYYRDNGDGGSRLTRYQRAVGRLNTVGTVNVCECDFCKEDAQSRPEDNCPKCGYRGPFVPEPCTCTDYLCTGGSDRGKLRRDIQPDREGSIAPCCHGTFFCPCCLDGGKDPWYLLRLLRNDLEIPTDD